MQASWRRQALGAEAPGRNHRKSLSFFAYIKQKEKNEHHRSRVGGEAQLTARRGKQRRQASQMCSSATRPGKHDAVDFHSCSWQS